MTASTTHTAADSPIIVQFEDCGKRFNDEWIFRHFNFRFLPAGKYAITGPNGSGKSTLLQIISGAIVPSEGKMLVQDAAGKKPNAISEELHQYFSLAAPYLDVLEEMTATEFLKFHAAFKPLLPEISPSEILQLVGLSRAAAKQIRYYSSGMKQRMKLAQAIFSDVPVLLLDEPCTNFDEAGFALYHQLIDRYCSNKMVIVSSNDPNEYEFCQERIHIPDYKS